MTGHCVHVGSSALVLTQIKPVGRLQVHLLGGLQVSQVRRISAAPKSRRSRGMLHRIQLCGRPGLLILVARDPGTCLGNDRLCIGRGGAALPANPFVATRRLQCLLIGTAFTSRGLFQRLFWEAAQGTCHKGQATGLPLFLDLQACRAGGGENQTKFRKLSRAHRPCTVEDEPDTPASIPCSPIFTAGSSTASTGAGLRDHRVLRSQNKLPALLRLLDKPLAGKFWQF